MSQLFTVGEVCNHLGVDAEVIQRFVEQEWIVPASANHYLDEIDLARARLILELRNEFGANDESIPIILRLIDQVHCLRGKILQLNKISISKGGI